MFSFFFFLQFHSLESIFFDKMRFEHTALDVVKGDELAPDYGCFYAPNIQKMYNCGLLDIHEVERQATITFLLL